MARAIVRLSLDGHANNALQIAKRTMAPTLRIASSTGTVERYGSMRDLLDALRDLIDHLATDLPAAVNVDHLWIYLDKSTAPVFDTD